MIIIFLAEGSVLSQSVKDSSVKFKLHTEVNNFYSFTKNYSLNSEQANALGLTSHLSWLVNKNISLNISVALVKKIFSSENISGWYQGTTINNRYELGVFDMAQKRTMNCLQDLKT